MKKAGYKPEQASAIEAAASTGGMIMPPIMGAMIFIMMAITGTPYIQLMAMCAIPAILYFLSVFLYAQFQAMKMKIISVTVEEVDRSELLMTAPLFILPLFFLIILLIKGFSLSFTVSLSIVLLVSLSFIRKKTRPPLRGLVRGLVEGASVAAGIAASMGAIGIMLATLAMTGLILKVPAFVEAVSGGDLTLALIMTMFASIIIGMGSSTTAAYVLVAMICGPSLMKMGLTMVQAHLFCVYFALMGFLTPPIAIGAMIASRLAGSRYMKTAVEASKVAIAGFIIPYLFVWCPVLLLQPVDPLLAIAGIIASLLIVVCLQIVICGHYLTIVSPWDRAIFAIAALLIFLSLARGIHLLLFTAIIIFMIATIFQWRKRQLGTSVLLAKGGY
jgi:TRAP transporter 4TM/12TM fusion protein